ncbi:hypothetical protein LOK49_Contig233G00002 [Camellia lanceoleosa]|nr:hypothetical protein LOK49_Contig233G00002 [Camellia lanceoleosa]
MSMVVKVLEGSIDVENNLDYNFTIPVIPRSIVAAGQQEYTTGAATTLLFPSALSGPRYGNGCCSFIFIFIFIFSSFLFLIHNLERPSWTRNIQTTPKSQRNCGGASWWSHKVTGISASISSKPKEELRTRPSELVNSILSMVTQIDRGVLLARDEHNKVAEVAQELGRFCIDEPVKCPLIFGEWDVVYCFVPTSPRGGYRSAFGRLVFKTKEMIQFVEAPDTEKQRAANERNRNNSFPILSFIPNDYIN